MGAKSSKPTITLREDEAVGSFIHDNPRYRNFWNWLVRYDNDERKDLFSLLNKRDHHWFVVVPIPERYTIATRASHTGAAGGVVSMAQYVIGTYVGQLTKADTELPGKKKHAVSIVMWPASNKVSGRQATLEYLSPDTFKLTIGPWTGKDEERDAFGSSKQQDVETMTIPVAGVTKLSNGYVVEGENLPSLSRREFVEVATQIAT